MTTSVICLLCGILVSGQIIYRKRERDQGMDGNTKWHKKEEGKKKGLDRLEYFQWPGKNCGKRVLLFFLLFVTFSMFCFLDLLLYRSMLLRNRRAKTSFFGRLIQAAAWRGAWSHVTCSLMFLLQTSHCSGQLLTSEQKARGSQGSSWLQVCGLSNWLGSVQGCATGPFRITC